MADNNTDTRADWDVEAAPARPSEVDAERERLVAERAARREARLAALAPAPEPEPRERIVYLPAATITHYEGKSSEQVVAARHLRFNTSKVRYFRKHHGALQAGVLRLALLAMYAVEWLIEFAKWLAGSRRALRRERLRAYGQLIRSGLRIS